MKIKNVMGKIDIEKYRHADAAYCESHEWDAKEDAARWVNSARLDQICRGKN